MHTNLKTAAFALAAVVAAHALVGAASYSALQTKADHAVMPIVAAERIEVRSRQVVKAERIVVSAKRDGLQLALTRWAAVA